MNEFGYFVCRKCGSAECGFHITVQDVADQWKFHSVFTGCHNCGTGYEAKNLSGDMAGLAVLGFALAWNASNGPYSTPSHIPVQAGAKPFEGVFEQYIRSQ